MKKCSNPTCISADELYSDDEYMCPMCHNILEPFDEDVDDYRLVPTDPPESKFLTVQENKFICHGLICEVDHQELFLTTTQKLINSIFKGEPFQIGKQNSDYAVRLENISDSRPTEFLDINLYGRNYLGRLRLGDELEITGNIRSGRYIGKTVKNLTTGTTPNGGMQLPSNLLSIAALISLPFLPFIVMGWAVIKITKWCMTELVDPLFKK